MHKLYPGRALLGFTALFSASLAIAPAARADNLTCEATVQVTNKKPAAIKVLNFHYTAGGQKQKEGLANRKLSPGETEKWKNQKLQHVAAGNPITSAWVEYRDDTSGKSSPSDPWGPVRSSAAAAQSGDCKDGRTYTLVVQ